MERKKGILKHLGLLKVGVLLAMVFLAGCDKAAPIERSIMEVNEVLMIRAKAIETKDLELYKSIIYKDYSENGVTYNDVVQSIERIFAKEGGLKYVYQKARPSVTMNSARVVHMVEYHFAASGDVAKDHEKLYLRKIDGRWLISGGVSLAIAP